MSTVAEQLRRAREEKALTVQQVVEITKMRSDHVRALEAGDYSIFSAPVYIRGFVRTYSTLLHLNVPAMMQQLEIELGNPGTLGGSESITPGAGGGLDRFMLFLSKVDWAKGGLRSLPWWRWAPWSSCLPSNQHLKQRILWRKKSHGCTSLLRIQENCYRYRPPKSPSELRDVLLAFTCR
jgi:hypothetical protein